MDKMTYTTEVYPEPWLTLPALTLGALGIWLGIHFVIAWYWFVLIVVSALFTACAIHWRAIIDPARKTVREEAFLFGRKFLWRRQHSFEDFKAIVFGLLDSDPEQWGVGLCHCSGRKIWIKKCGCAGGQSPPGRAAEEFAWRLSCDTGIEIKDYKPARFRMPFCGLRMWIAVSAVILMPLCFNGCGTSNSATVILYCAQDQTYAEPLLAQFEKETGIKVKPVYDSEAVKTVGLANRLLAERSHPQCDVFWGNEELRTRQLAAQDVFRATNGWTAFGHRSRRLVINTNLISATDLPRSLMDLTNATWRGKVALAYPQFGTTGTHMHALRQFWGDASWLAWGRALVANQAKLVDGNSVVVKLVGRGEAAIGLTDSDDILAGQREGLPVAMLPRGPESLLIPNTVAVIRNARHAAAAQKLFDWLQKPEVVQRLVDANALESIERSGGDTLQPDWPAILRDLDATTKQLNEVFLK